MKKLLLLLMMAPAAIHAQVNIDSWMMNVNGDKATYWNQTGTAGAPAYTWTVSPDSANVLKVCYSADSIWVRAQGLTDSMGRYKNPGPCYAQNYIFRFPRNPAPAAVKTNIPKVFAIGALLNGVPIYGLSNSFSWNGTANLPGPGGHGIWNVEVGMSEGFVLDSAFGAHPQQAGAYHTHTTPYRFYRNTPAGRHSPLVGYAFDGYPVYGPYGYTNPTDSMHGVTRMISGYSLRNITQRHTLPDSTVLLAADDGPDVSSTYPLGYYCEDYEWLASNGGTLDKYNGRFCITPEYPAGTYAYFVTTDATGAAAYPYYMGTQYYGSPDTVNFYSNNGLHMPSGSAACISPAANEVVAVTAAGNGFTIYPNPATGHLTLLTQAQEFSTLTICSLTGAVVCTKDITASRTEMELYLAPGTYFVKCFNTATGITEVQALVVR